MGLQLGPGKLSARRAKDFFQASDAVATLGKLSYDVFLQMTGWSSEALLALVEAAPAIAAKECRRALL
eukprot:6634844-Alexandrium_andersonii.AAC.1